uniref:Uncharacterized protein n=1 Tax=Mycena chlorophos TaxID=658473 RepID=A0ABQ0LAL2_MYCCL|nr:predicted protein [Mycena chlorophos]
MRLVNADCAGPCQPGHWTTPQTTHSHLWPSRSLRAIQRLVAQGSRRPIRSDIHTARENAAAETPSAHIALVGTDEQRAAQATSEMRAHTLLPTVSSAYAGLTTGRIERVDLRRHTADRRESAGLLHGATHWIHDPTASQSWLGSRLQGEQTTSLALSASSRGSVENRR